MIYHPNYHQYVERTRRRRNLNLALALACYGSIGVFTLLASLGAFSLD